MAIQATITTIQGVTLPTAYINLANPQIIKTKSEDINTYSLSANACVYVDKASYDTGKIPLEGFAVTCDLNIESNALTQAYTALKSNPRLQNITEV